MSTNEAMNPCELCKTPNQIKNPGYFEICHVCGWEDEPFQTKYPDEIGPNKISLNEGIKRWERGETLFSRYPNPKQIKSA